MTGIFGKSQPLKTEARNMNLTSAEIRQISNDKREYKRNTFGTGGRRPGMENKNFHRLGTYQKVTSEKDFYYDYSFTAGSPCCQPTGYYENGVAIEPVSKYAIQRTFPGKF